MATSQADVKSNVIELSTESFEKFCDDISGMFGIEMECEQKEPCNETVKELGKRFKKISAVNHIESEGILDGKFKMVFDKEGLFTLAGVIVMLPEKRILENIKRGTSQDAEDMSDAIGEAGNLLVGSWDRIFREEMEGHKHFVQTGTFVGNPWGSSQEKIGIAGDEELLFIPYEITIDKFPVFNCGVIFPESIFAEKAVTEPVETVEDVQEVIEESVEAEVVANEEPVKAEDETPAEVESVVNEKTVEAEDKPVADTVEAEAVEESAETEKEIIEQVAEKQEDAVEEETTVEAEQVEAVQAEDKVEQAAGPVSETIQKMAQSASLASGNAATMCAKDIMQKDVVWGSVDDSVQDALTKMQQGDAGYMMVGADGKLEGIVSTFDIAASLSIYLKPMFAKWRSPTDDATLQIKIKWVMSRPVQTIKPDTTVAAIMENMRQSGLRCLPVVDKQGVTVGFVTVFDVFGALLNTDSDLSAVGKTSQAPSLV